MSVIPAAAGGHVWVCGPSTFQERVDVHDPCYQGHMNVHDLCCHLHACGQATTGDYSGIRGTC